MRVSELTGAVGGAGGRRRLRPDFDQGSEIIIGGHSGRRMETYAPHENWAQGGPLLDEWAVMFEWAESAVLGEVFAYMTPEVNKKVGCYAPDRLTGGMRAIVMHFYGDEVEEVAE